MAIKEKAKMSNFPTEENLKRQESESDLAVYFVNKFNWFDASPMATVSTLSMYNVAARNIPTTLIIEGDPESNTREVLRERFDLEPISNFNIQLIHRPKKGKRKSTGTFYKTAFELISGEKTQRKKVVISRNTTFLPYLRKLKKEHGCMVLFEAHGYHGTKNLPDLPKRHFAKWAHKHSSYRYIERMFLNSCNGLICITKPQERLYKADFLKIPSIVLPLASKNAASTFENDVIEKRFQAKRLVYIGRLTDHIDVDLMIQGVKELSEKAVTLAWIGLKPGDIKVLEQKIKEHDAPRSAFELIQWISHQDMMKYLSENASIGLATYKPTYRSAVVTCPTKLFDYFAIGLPVVGARIPTVQDIVTDLKEGVLFSPSDVKSFNEAVLKIFSDQQHYDEMHRAALKAAVYFSWENRAKRLLNFVDQLNS